jgi:predicted acylesterase/phospholipase RssA
MTRETTLFGGDGPLSLCLSGGGFRATCFHLGVVRLLAELDCLKRVTHVFSVSGGSILAAHLGLNWAAYADRSEFAFQDLTDDLVRFIRHDLRGRIVRRWLLFQPRAATLQREYDTFFKSARLRELPRTPNFYFATTSMTTGRLCAFTRDGFLVVREDGKVDRYPAEAQPVAQAVAASSAFPPLFPPLRLDLPDLPRAVFPTAEHLTDGGVFDNLGIACLRRLLTDDTVNGFDRILVSDASALFDHSPETRFLLLPTRATRTTDILMQRAGALETELWSRLGGGRLAMVRISDVVDDVPIKAEWFRTQSPKAQRLLRGVRTDFDAFPVDLIRALVQHGYEVAFQSALASALSYSMDDYRTIALRQGEETRADEMRPWDPMPPGWPNRKRMREYARRAALQKPLLNLQESLGKAARALGGEPNANVKNTRDDVRARDRRSTERLETLLATASTRPIALWNGHDWISWILLVLAMILIASTVSIISWVATHR